MALYAFCLLGLLTTALIPLRVMTGQGAVGLIALLLLSPVFAVFGRPLWLRPRGLRVSRDGVHTDFDVVRWADVSAVRFEPAFLLPFRFAVVEHAGGRLTTVVPTTIDRGSSERAVAEAWASSGAEIQTAVRRGTVSSLTPAI